MGVEGGVGRRVGSPIYILKALSLSHYDWIHLSHMFNPEQVSLLGLEQIDYTVLHQALPLLGLGIPPPKPPIVTVGEVPGHSSSKIQALIPGKWKDTGRSKTTDTYSQNSSWHKSTQKVWKWSHSVMSDSSRPHGLQPTRFLCPWDFPGKSTGVDCHCLLKSTQQSHIFVIKETII